jgi:hypothetical protein
MDSKLIEVGEQYGYREYPQRKGTSLQRIEALERTRSNKWKVRFLDPPHPGLEDYVKSIHIVVRWAESQSFLEDERRLQKVIEASAKDCDGRDDPIAGAVDVVLRATGEHVFLDNLNAHSPGRAEVPVEAARRILMRTNLDWDPLALDPLAFVDRCGSLQLPFRAALKLAQAFAHAEPDSVALTLAAEQHRWEEDCRVDLSESTTELVNRWRAGWALARQWTMAGQDMQQETLALDELRRRVEATFATIWTRIGRIDDERLAEICRLRELVEDAARRLKVQGADAEAEAILTQLDKEPRALVRRSVVS